MIYLAARIFLYLLFALALGMAAGWLWRHREAEAEAAAMERRLMEVRGRLPRADAVARQSEARLDAVMVELEAREQELAARHALLVAERQRVEELEEKCAELTALLTQAQAAAARREAPPVARQDAGELDDVREKLSRAERALRVEQRRVEELSRERELQRRALTALEQQLELVRENGARAANG